MERQSIGKFFTGFFVMAATAFIFVSFVNIIVMKRGVGFFAPEFDFFIFAMYLYFFIQMYCYLPEEGNHCDYYGMMTLIFFFGTLGSLSILISNFAL